MKIIHMVPSLLIVAEAQGETGTLYSVISSVEVSPDGELFSQVWGKFKPGCRTVGYALEPETDKQWYGGKRVTRLFKVFDRCPEGITHTCAMEG